MKKIKYPLIALGLCALVPAVLCMIPTRKVANPAPKNVIEITYSHDGMAFSVENVVETFGYNETAWYMVYNDPDAGMDYEVIRLNKRTHNMIVSAQNRRKTLTGTLNATRLNESVEYNLEAEQYTILYQYTTALN